MRRWLAVPLLLVAILLCCGCSRSRAQSKGAPLARQYSAAGGGAIDPVRALAKRLDQLHPGASIQTRDVGSPAGVQLTENGSTDFSFASRDLSRAEKAELSALPIETNGSAVVVDAENPITGLTTEQVRKIFSGEVSDWAEAGGPPGKIRIVIREKTAWTRTSFEDHFFAGQRPAHATDASEVRDIGQMTESIKSFQAAIGTVTLEDQTLKEPAARLISIGGIPATMTTLSDSSYPLRRELYLIANPDSDKSKPAVRAFLDFAQSPAGRKVLSQFNARAIEPRTA